jgi:hypothetical protein
MMQRLLVCLALAGLAAPAVAEVPYSCTAAGAQRLHLSSGRTTLLFRGRFSAPAPLDPHTLGLEIEVSYDPETDPANAIFHVELPAAAFTPIPHGVLYKDPSGARGGITLVKLRTPSRGPSTLTIIRRGTPLAAATRAGNVHVAVAAGPRCVRTCGSVCRVVGTTRLACRPPTDTGLCGLLSGAEVLNAASGNPLLPYPSSFYERPDASTVTGRRIAYSLRVMPTNASGVHIDPTAWSTLDGFSPGPILMAAFPQGVDLAASGVGNQTDWTVSLGAASPTILLDADTGERIEHMGENDVSTGNDGVTPVHPPTQAFMIRPGRRLANGHHYIVALRGLIGQDGQPIPPDPAFKALRDGTPSGNAALEARRPAFEALFATLAAAGIPRGDLILAWDFHTASDDAIERWLLSMRDQTFAQLGGVGGSAAPAFVVTSVQDNPFNDPRVCRRVAGTYTVPLFTTFNGPGSLLNLNPVTNLPVQNGVATDIPFTAIIPCSLVQPTPQAGRPIFYGHGLLGTGAGEVGADNLRNLAQNYGFVIAATDWQGFAAADLGTIVGFIGDFSGFRKLPERLHQGILNQLVLARLLGSPHGLAADPAFQFDDGTGHMVSVIDPTEVYYYGNSQGGIEGGVVMAIAQEVTRGVLGVAAANYSTLLQRSVDFNPFFVLLRGAYPDDLNRALVYPLIQQLWDRAEPNGYDHHTVANPLPNTPAHKVLVHMATGDAEVSNLGTEIMVRSMGIPQIAPPVHHFFDIPEQLAPFDGSALVEVDGGFPPAPLTNVPPANNSAHQLPRSLPAIQAQIDAFLRPAGDVENFCVGPCDPQ